MGGGSRVCGSGPAPCFGGGGLGWVSAICVAGVGRRLRRGRRRRLDALMIFEFSSLCHSTRSLHAQQLLIVLRQQALLRLSATSASLGNDQDVRSRDSRLLSDVL